MSPYNKIEVGVLTTETLQRIGSCVYDDEDVVVVLWRLSTLKSSFLAYFPDFITRRKTEIQVREGALDVHVTPDGKIYKLVNRKVSMTRLRLLVDSCVGLGGSEGDGGAKE